MAPKVIIIEGPDNCGKDTLIERLSKNYKNPVVIHCSQPTGDNLTKFYFDGLIYKTLDCYYNNNVDAIIHNRSMYGEYVYGQKYRNENLDSIKSMLYNLEVGQLKTFIFKWDLFFILLTSDSVKLLSDHDDGLSISSKSEDIKEEIKLFEEVFSSSLIENKKRVLVNDGDNFRDKDSIYQEVLNFIKGAK